MAVAVDRVLAVGHLLPDGVGDELVLRLGRPVVVPRRMPLVHADAPPAGTGCRRRGRAAGRAARGLPSAG